MTACSASMLIETSPHSPPSQFFFCTYLWRHSLTDKKRKQTLFLSPQRCLVVDFVIVATSLRALCYFSGSASTVSTPVLSDLSQMCVTNTILMCCIWCFINSDTCLVSTLEVLQLLRSDVSSLEEACSVFCELCEFLNLVLQNVVVTLKL